MKRETSNGFILLDILFAVMVCSVALAAVSAMFVPAINAYSSASDYTVAANLAQKQMELLKAQPPAFWDGTLPRTVAWQGAETMPVSLNGVDYHITTQVLVTDTSNSLVEVQVTVNWSKGSIPQSMQMMVFLDK